MRSGGVFDLNGCGGAGAARTGCGDDGTVGAGVLDTGGPNGSW